MASLHSYAAAPGGLRFADVFKIVDKAEAPTKLGDHDVVRFSVTHAALPLQVAYVGLFGPGYGSVSYMRVDAPDGPWFLFGDELDPRHEFSFAGSLESFHESPDPVAALLSGDDTLKGSLDADWLEAYGGDDSLDAGAGNDRLEGGSGSDFLEGGAGADTMIGGAGDDSYVVDQALDVVMESEDGGEDAVFTSVSYALAEGVAVERLAASLAKGVGLTGNSGANMLVGNVGADRLRGLGGEDRLYGDGGRDTLEGGDGLDVLYGGMGNDSLRGGSGDDVVYGDVGNDILKGDAGDDVLYSGTGNDTLAGGTGNDRLFGDTGSDRLAGDGGNDILYGGLGNNSLRGGSGDDVLYGSQHRDSLAGDAGNDRLHGDAGTDILNGGLGRDVLAGGTGADAFVFDTRPNARANLDRITDFRPGQDRLHLDDAVFRALGLPGALHPSVFTIGRTAQDADDRVIYDPSRGILSYDPDGTGPAARTAFATLAKFLPLTAADILVV
ncbi:MAG TPA: calcium-binding protein [Microvirga sp.]|jgi:Ca2+-binding RTX toxin-like protein